MNIVVRPVFHSIHALPAIFKFRIGSLIIITLAVSVLMDIMRTSHRYVCSVLQLAPNVSITLTAANASSVSA